MAAVVVAAFVTILCTPLVGRFASHYGVIDTPDHRAVHKSPVPRLGGIAIFAGFLAGVGTFLAFRPDAWARELSGLLIGAAIIVIVGVLDDAKNLPAKYKFLGQLAAAAVVVGLGPRIEFIGTPWGSVFYLDPWLAFILSMFWIVGLVNIINFSDGLDGLAAGVSTIAAGTLFVHAVLSGHPAGAFIPLVLAAVCLGFLWHNFNPASIFMGDSGSMLLGLVLGAVTVSSITKGLAFVTLLVPLVIVAIPIADTVFAILRRLVKGQPISAPDKGHIHHRLLEKGGSHKRTVLLIYAWSFILSVSALGLQFAPASMRTAVIVALVAASFWLVHSLGLFEALWGSMVERTTPKRARKDHGDG